MNGVKANGSENGKVSSLGDILFYSMNKYKDRCAQVIFAFFPPYDAAEYSEHRSDKFDTSSLRLILTGSAPVPKKLMKDFKQVFPHIPVLQGYGQTEHSGLVTMFKADVPENVEMQFKKPRSCGKMISYLQWKIVDLVTEEVVGPYKEGELRVKSDSESDSCSAFDSDGYLKTGDILYYDDEYCFYVVEQLKEMFKCRGCRIVPSILEEILLLHHALKEAAVIAVPHEVDGSHPMGVVVLRDEYSDTTADEVKMFVENNVYELQKFPAGVKIVKNLPRTITGKIQRNVVAKRVLSGIV